MKLTPAIKVDLGNLIAWLWGGDARGSSNEGETNSTGLYLLVVYVLSARDGRPCRANPERRGEERGK